MIVYVTTNIMNNKQYVGQSNSKSVYYLGSGILIKKAINKYGRNSFEKIIVYESDLQDEIDSVEQQIIHMLNTFDPKGYNLDCGGKSSPKMSRQTKQKLSKAHTGKVLLEEHKRKISEALKGMEFTEEHRRKIRDASLGKIMSTEARRKMSEKKSGIKRKPFTEETKRRMSLAQLGNTKRCGKKHPHSEKTKQVISIAMKRAWIKRKKGDIK